MNTKSYRSLFLALTLVSAVFVQACVSIGQTRSSVPAELLGEWHNGNVSMLSEKDLTTGRITSSNGSTFTYKFLPGGRFEYIGYMKSTMYGCTTDLFNHQTGRVAVNGSTITFTPDKNYWKNTYSCAPKSNKERNYKLDKEVKEFEMREDEQGRKLFCLLGGEKDACYREVEKN
jgi:hypothetical protein